MANDKKIAAPTPTVTAPTPTVNAPTVNAPTVNAPIAEPPVLNTKVDTTVSTDANKSFDYVVSKLPDSVSDRPDSVANNLPDSIGDKLQDSVDSKLPDAIDDKLPDAIDDKLPDAIDDIKQLQTDNVNDSTGLQTELALIDKHVDALRAIAALPGNLAKKQGKFAMQPAIGSLLMSIVAEVNEAHAAFANNVHSSQDDLAVLNDLLSQHKYMQFAKYFKAVSKSTFEDELADILLITLSIANYYNIDIIAHARAKHAYNTVRSEHSKIHEY